MLGIVEVLRQTQIDQSATFNGTYYLVAATLFVAITIRPRASRTGSCARSPAAAGRGSRERQAPALELEGVHKSFDKLEVLRGIDLELAEHEVVCMIGASGSGKSTLLRCVNLLELIAAGRISSTARRSWRAAWTSTASGGDRDRLPVLQPLPAHVGARERDARAAKPAALAWRSRRRAERLLERFGLAEKRDEYPRPARKASSSASRSSARSQCSRGCCCSTRSPALSTPELVAEVLDVIRELAAGGMTTLVATWRWGSPGRREPQSSSSTRRILEQGPPEQIFGDPREERTQQFLQRIVAAGRL